MPSKDATVLFGDDAILRHVDETAGENPEFAVLSACVGQALRAPDAVSTNEVLQNRQSLRESSS